MALKRTLTDVLPIFKSLRITNIRLNCHRASISRTNRNFYPETYKVSLIFPDGSSTVIRYKEPIASMQLPLDLSKLTEEEKQLILLKRKGNTVKVVEDDIEESFDSNQYSYLWK